VQHLVQSPDGFPAEARGRMIIDDSDLPHPCVHDDGTDEFQKPRFLSAFEIPSESGLLVRITLLF
jgi:hypothetical protein